jgi:hypothetical protein
MCVAVTGHNGQILDSLEVKLIDQLLREEFPFLVARRIAKGAHLNVVWAQPNEVIQSFSFSQAGPVFKLYLY